MGKCRDDETSRDVWPPTLDVSGPGARGGRSESRTVRETLPTRPETRGVHSSHPGAPLHPRGLSVLPVLLLCPTLSMCGRVPGGGLLGFHLLPRGRLLCRSRKRPVADDGLDRNTSLRRSGSLFTDDVMTRRTPARVWDKVLLRV